MRNKRSGPFLYHFGVALCIPFDKRASVYFRCAPNFSTYNPQSNGLVEWQHHHIKPSWRVHFTVQIGYESSPRCYLALEPHLRKIGVLISRSGLHCRAHSYQTLVAITNNGNSNADSHVRQLWDRVYSLAQVFTSQHNMVSSYVPHNLLESRFVFALHSSNDSMKAL